MSPSSYQISRHIEEHVYDTSAVLVGFVLCNFKPQRERGGGREMEREGGGGERENTTLSSNRTHVSKEFNFGVG